jgi:hypothetical protein
MTHYVQTPFAQLLDAVSVLYQWDIQEAKALWRAWHGKATAEVAFRELESHSLVYVDRAHRLQTHPVVRSLGLGVLRDPDYVTPEGAERARYYGSKLWRCAGSEFLDCSKVRDWTSPQRLGST